MGLVWVSGGYWVVVSCLFGVRSCARLCLLKGCWAKVSVGVCGCLGEGCVVRGGVVPVWLCGAVACGGVGVSFDVGSRVFVLSGVSVPESGSGASVSSPAVSGSASASVSVSSCGPVVPECGGVVVCAPCAVRVFGDSWCELVLRRWARAAGVDVAKVDALLGSASGSGSVRSVASGGAASSSEPAVVSGSSSSSPSPVSGGSASLRSPVGGGRVGAGFGARVRDWGAWVGVGGGVVSGGGVVAGWWQRSVGRVSGLVSGVGVKGLVLAGLVGVVVLVSALVLVG